MIRSILPGRQGGHPQSPAPPHSLPAHPRSQGGGQRHPLPTQGFGSQGTQRQLLHPEPPEACQVFSGERRRREKGQEGRGERRRREKEERVGNQGEEMRRKRRRKEGEKAEKGSGRLGAVSRGVVGQVEEEADVVHGAVLLEVCLEEASGLHVHLRGAATTVSTSSPGTGQPRHQSPGGRARSPQEGWLHIP